eukprot:CAMPEP_0183502346 /NCGR_PEP_ID=MMETSP0371-20130417/4167_1 /TAXON_ID=268820 /ORGANISM="Peridinium aciculiferum, Strain PAER-2" /LENGTH=701 /DNA_ID=CAMNT_0025697039 /DNA_START=91 /DNA_END=2196 /DNA_ORIENTATION=-
MKTFSAALLLCACSAVAGTADPLGKVLDLMAELEAKIIKQGEAEAKAYKEYFDWCDDTSKNGQFAIETATNEGAELTAKIDQLTSNAATASDEIEDLAGAIATAETELKDATLIREKEDADFKSSESELVDAVDTLDRAVGILEREMAKNPAALAQISTNSNGMAGMIQAINAVLDAAAFPGSDQKKLMAFVQSQQAADEDDAVLGAPAAATYKSQSGNIVEVLEDMKEKAEGQLGDLRKAETNAKHNFEMLKQSLEDQLAADNKDMSEEKSAKAAAEEAKATAEGDLGVAKKDLATSQEALATAHTTCMQVASDHEATATSRGEELKAIAEAKQILKETSSGAVSQSYSFLQLESRADLKRSEVVTMVTQLAKLHHSVALAQLASRIAAVVKYGAMGGDGPFGKVKSLITDMIFKLEKEMTEEADEKAYCHEQLSKTEAKKADLEDDVAKMTSKVDQAASKSAELKAQVQELQAELAALAKESASMDKIRQETHADYGQAKADLELGLSGVRKALQVLREYYGGGAAAAAMIQDDGMLSSLMQQPAVPEHHSKAGGAGGSILGILEVVESDFAKNLATEETEEEDAQAAYEKITQENKIVKTTKEQDEKYKTQESKSLDQTIAEISSDRETTNTELAAVSDYYSKIKDRCIAKPETYEDRTARRDAEIKGLKEALAVLEDETAFVQRKHRSFRGSALTPN